MIKRRLFGVAVMAICSLSAVAEPGWRFKWPKLLPQVQEATYDETKRVTLGEGFKVRLAVGDGTDMREVQDYAKTLRLDGKCLFTGPVRNRETLRAWYARADLFLFPSTFDTNGLVVREAAASGLASVLVRGSCAAEDTEDCANAFWIALAVVGEK